MTIDDSVNIANNVRWLGGLDIAGGGQVVVQDGYAFVGHMKPPHGTTIINVSDPTAPSVVAEISTDGPYSHTHKVRVAGDLMITNVEQNDRRLMGLGSHIPDIRQALSDSGSAPTNAAVAAELGVEEALARSYSEGGWKVWDVSDKSAPREIAYVRTHGFGVHWFDMDANYAYMSTEMDGYVGNILVIYDLADPTDPQEVSRWWMPGQHVANGENPTGRAQAIGFTTRSGWVTNCGQRFGMPVSGWSISLISQRRTPWPRTTIIRRSRSRPTRSCRCPNQSKAVVLPWRLTKNTRE